MVQAASIMRLRRTIGKRKASEAELEDKQDERRTDEAVTEATKASRKWAGQQEQADAKLPQQQPSNEQREAKHGGVQERIRMETSNVTSLNSNRETALARTAHFQAVQEACLSEAQIAAMKTAANLRG